VPNRHENGANDLSHLFLIRHTAEIEHGAEMAPTTSGTFFLARHAACCVPEIEPTI